mgnify:FL=1
MLFSNLLEIFRKHENKEKFRNIKHKSSLEDISQYQVILISGLKHLVTNIDKTYIQALGKFRDSKDICRIQIALENYRFPNINNKEILKNVLLDFKIYHINDKDYDVADQMLIEAGI